MADLNTKLGIKVGFPDLIPLYETSGIIETGFNNIVSSSITYADIDDTINSPDAFLITNARGRGVWKPTGLFVKAGLYSGFSFWACPKAKPFYSGSNNGVTTFLRYEQFCRSGKAVLENDSPDYFVVYNLEGNYEDLNGTYYLHNTTGFDRTSYQTGRGYSGLTFSYVKTFSYPVYSGDIGSKSIVNILRLEHSLSSGTTWFGQPYLSSGKTWKLHHYDLINKFEYLTFWLATGVPPRDIKNYAWGSDFDHDPYNEGRGPRFIDSNRTSRWVMSAIWYPSAAELSGWGHYPPYPPNAWFGDEDYYYSLDGGISLSKMHEAPSIAWQQGAQYLGEPPGSGVPKLTPIYNTNPLPEWPMPCEYFSPEILASDFPLPTETFNQYDASGNKIPLLTGSGVVYYNLLSSIQNLLTGQSYVTNLFEDKSYKFTAINRINSGTLLIEGSIDSMEYDIFDLNVGTLSPTLVVIGQSGYFDFERLLEGYFYEIQYTNNLNSGWANLNINYFNSENQLNVPIGYVRSTFVRPISNVTGNNFYRVKFTPLFESQVGMFGLQKSGNNSFLEINFFDENDTYYYLYSDTSGNAFIQKDYDGIFICGGEEY